MNRRSFLLLSSTAPVLSMSGCLSLPRNELSSKSGHAAVQAIAFDAFPIFDPRAAFATINELFPVDGDRLRKAWFAKIFAYTWLRTSGKQYAPFDEIMEDALHVASTKLNVEVSEQQKIKILASFRAMPIWPDVREELTILRNNGLRLAFLSNMTTDMLESNMRHSQIEDLFDYVLSTDLAGAFKPAPAAYKLATDAFGLAPSKIGFAAFAGWDAAGASWFGFQTAWINRLGVEAERLGARNVIEARDLSGLHQIVGVIPSSIST